MKTFCSNCNYDASIRTNEPCSLCIAHSKWELKKYEGFQPSTGPDRGRGIIPLLKDAKPMEEMMLEALIEQLGKEKIGKIVIRNSCPHLFDLTDVKNCANRLRDCRMCWAKALGLKGDG
jgi:hypothetical protein